VRLSRRFLLQTGLVAASPPRLRDFHSPGQRGRRMGEWRHGLSLFGDIKYPPDFKHFDYVNAQAPKTGSVRMKRGRNLRQFQPCGRQRPWLARGHTAFGNIYDMLLTRPLDEGGDRLLPARRGGQLSAGFFLVTYRLRAEARLA